MVIRSEVVIKSQVKNVEGTSSYFEQRATNKEEVKSYYFNQPVVMFSTVKENKSLVKNIVENMRISIEKCGIGLAHNQYPQQNGATNPYAIFIIEGKGSCDHVLFEAFINPVIVGYSKEKVGFYHGCLSAIGIGQAKVSTYKELLIAFFSDDLELLIKKYTGMAAIICQHEFNHLSTCGTYVDTVNNYINNDRFQHAKELYLGLEDIQKLNEHREIIEPVQEDIPCLTTNEILVKCKMFLIDNKLYYNAVQKYLLDHPENKPLYDNLMALPSHISQLYLKDKAI